jgi:hypothetical protein
MVFRSETVSAICIASYLRYTLQTAGLMKLLLEPLLLHIQANTQSYEVRQGAMGASRLRLAGSLTAPCR